jgi:uncharacterized protein (DUF924 family)
MFLIRVGEIVTIAGHDCTPCGVLPGIPQMRRIRRHHADGWAASIRGRLALILVLDQMTRTVFPTIRAPTPVMPMHRRCRRSVRSGHRTRTRLRRVHVPRDAHGPRAEDLRLQERVAGLATKLAANVPLEYRTLGAMALEQTAKYLSVIRRFGRFPHRNAILGRISTREEVEFLETSAEAQPSTGTAEWRLGSHRSAGRLACRSDRRRMIAPSRWLTSVS